MSLADDGRRGRDDRKRRSTTRRRVLAAVLACGLWPTEVWGRPVKIDAQFRAVQKAVWVWRVDAECLRSLAESAKTRGIKTAFISLSGETVSTLLEGKEGLMPQLRILHAAGIELFALAGDPTWALSPDDMPRHMLALLELVQMSGVFGGIALDIEPHTLPSWHASGSEREQLMHGTIKIVGEIRQRASGLPIDAAVHPTYARLTFGGGANFLKALAEQLSSASVMSYRNRAETAVHWSAGTIDALESLGKPWRLGVLVHPSNEPNTSYFGLARNEFMHEMVRLDRILRRGPAGRYCGLIIEDHRGLQALLGAS